MFQKLKLLFYAFYDLKLLISFLQVYVKCILNLKNRFSKDFRGEKEREREREREREFENSLF